MTTELERDVAALARAARAVTVRVIDGTRGAGSGVVWNGDGEIVTNAHVVRGDRARIEWEDGRGTRACVVRRDDAADLALLRPEPGAALGSLAVANVRPDATVRPGDFAAAVGNPHGLAWAFTAGFVRGRNARWVMTSVRLAPGNSGGPLVDSAGRVIGINSMVAGDLGLAIASDVAAAFVDRARARLGVAVARAVATLGGRRTAVLVVTAIEPRSTAERSGLARGDAIVAIEGAPLDATPDIERALAGARTLGILRVGERATIALDRRENARAA